MKLIINKDRTTVAVGTWGTVNENDYEILDFEFPAELEEYNKRIVYYLGDERVWDTIVNNKAYITNAITTKGDVKAYVWCTKENTEREADTDFRTMLFEMHFYENENADGIVPTEEQVDGFNTMLTAMNAKIDEVDALETTIETAEAQRQEAEATRVSNENTRESNESTRQTNEETRQSQEADRERRTDEAIGNIEDKTAEYNANAEAKTTAFNQNATQKTNEFNSNYTQKVNDFNTNATTQETDFNSNASSKTSSFNSNAETKTNTFNTNATNKTNDFNSNATEKTTTFNNNASTKTSEFNSNAESKTSTFNDNATSKTNDFNDNATEKTTDYNTNAQNKIDEYDEHIVEYQAQIDELQEEVEELSENMPWSTTEQATEISVTDAAKYSRNKLELFGNTSQDSTSGKNRFSGWEEGLINPTTGEEYIYSGRYRSKGYIEIESNTNYYFSMLQPSSSQSFWVFIYKYDENKQYIGRQPLKEGVPQAYENIVNISDTTTKYIRFTEIASVEYINETQFELGTEKTSYEPYTGGQPSPSSDYPQDIHIFTGENTIHINNTDYPLSLGDMEFGKIGESQDDFFKNEPNNSHYDSSLVENGWYKNEIIKKFLFKNAPNESWTVWRVDLHEYQIRTDIQDSRPNGMWISALCDKFKNVSVPGISMKDNEFSAFSSRITGDINYIYFRFKKDPIDNLNDFKAFVENNNLLAYTILDKPVPVQITDETLISQLDEIYEHLKLVKGTNNITVTAQDLAPNMQLSYMQDVPSKLNNLASRIELLEE